MYCHTVVGDQFNPYAAAIGGIPMRQGHSNIPPQLWRQSSQPVRKREEEQNPWNRSMSDSAHNRGMLIQWFEFSLNSVVAQERRQNSTKIRVNYSSLEEINN